MLWRTKHVQMLRLQVHVIFKILEHLHVTYLGATCRHHCMVSLLPQRCMAWLTCPILNVCGSWLMQQADLECASWLADAQVRYLSGTFIFPDSQALVQLGARWRIQLYFQLSCSCINDCVKVTLRGHLSPAMISMYVTKSWLLENQLALILCRCPSH